jgi:hypothetical protein
MSKPDRKPDERELRALIEQRFGAAMTDHETLMLRRAKAMDYYYGRPLGNEIDGRAQVVTKDFMDTVEWEMPSYMRIFTTKDCVQFDAVGPEDEQLAKQETQYTSHVLWKQNDGFNIIYSWLRDGIMQVVGYVIYWWEVEEKVSTETYTGLTQDQLALVAQDLEGRGEYEIVEAETGHTAPGVPQTFDVKFKITSKKGRLCIEAVPPDEVVVSNDCKGSVKNAKFAGRIRKVTRSELLKQGYSRGDVEKVTDFTWNKNQVQTARDRDNQATHDDDGVDWATREFTLLDCFTDIDADGDGFAEKRHFVVHGDGFLENEECDEIQMCSWTKIPMQHQHQGLDTFDLTEDLQRTNTALTRGLLDNTYFSANQRLIYDKNTVNVSMLQVNRPGGHVANDGPPAGAVMPIPVNDVASRLLPVIQHVGETRTTRTGVGPLTNGADATVLADSTKGAYMDAKGAANQRIEATARIFAQNGLADLYQSIHKMLLKYQDWETKFKIRKDWVTVNPTEWKERASLTVSVGSGTASHEEVRQRLLLMKQTQQEVAAVPGLVQPQNAFALASRIQNELGFENENFITDPSSNEYKQFMAQASKTPPDPYIVGENIKAQTRLKEKQIDSRDKAMDRAQERDLTITKLEVDSGIDLALAGIGAEVAHSRAGRADAGAASAPGPGGAGAAGEQPVQ